MSQVAQVFRGAGAELGDQALLGARQMGRGALVEQFLLEALGPQRLTAPPAAGISDDLAMLVVDDQGLRIGFDSQPAADVAGRHTVTVAVELEAQIFVDESIGGVAVIGQQRW